ncbi:MAG: hypothetical protein IT353_18775 [Gemmatimonadaceae bacterium]|nr:hypothetical protein [Gemmatimonadaceae bacterium]
MTSLYWICLLLGGGIVVLQFGASVIGLDHDAPHSDFGHGPISEGLQLFSLRALSAGLAFFGVGGLVGVQLGLPGVVAIAPAFTLGTLAMFAVAKVLRGMQRLESDQTFRLTNAVGKSGEVYLSIPAARGGTGKIHITVQERLMELDAMTPEGDLATGTRVLVIDTIAPATVIVVPQPAILEDGAE